MKTKTIAPARKKPCQCEIWESCSECAPLKIKNRTFAKRYGSGPRKIKDLFKAPVGKMCCQWCHGRGHESATPSERCIRHLRKEKDRWRARFKHQEKQRLEEVKERRKRAAEFKPKITVDMPPSSIGLLRNLKVLHELLEPGVASLRFETPDKGDGGIDSNYLEIDLWRYRKEGRILIRGGKGPLQILPDCSNVIEVKNGTY